MRYPRARWVQRQLGVLVLSLRCEFGGKVSVDATLDEGLIVGMRGHGEARA